MKTEWMSATHDFAIVSDDEDENILAVQDHRGVFLCVEFDLQRVGIRGHEELDDRDSVLLSHDEASTVYQALGSLMVQKRAATLIAAGDLAVKDACIAVLDAISTLGEGSTHYDRAMALSKIEQAISNLPAVPDRSA